VSAYEYDVVPLRGNMQTYKNVTKVDDTGRIKCWNDDPTKMTIYSQTGYLSYTRRPVDPERLAPEAVEDERVVGVPEAPGGIAMRA
jgi:hypothetical protein